MKPGRAEINDDDGRGPADSTLSRGHGGPHATLTGSDRMSEAPGKSFWPRPLGPLVRGCRPGHGAGRQRPRPGSAQAPRPAEARTPQGRRTPEGGDEGRQGRQAGREGADHLVPQEPGRSGRTSSSGTPTRAGWRSISVKPAPTATFNFIPPKDPKTKQPKQYTLTDITDVINETLLAKGFILVRRQTTFRLWPADKAIDPSLVRRVSVDELKTLGQSATWCRWSCRSRS